MRLLPATILALASLPLEALADVRLPSVLGSGCVLQQNTEAAIFGYAAVDELVTVKTSWGVTATAKGGADGRWLVHVKTPAAGGGPQSFTVSGTANSVTSDDVLMGEVWLCGGQSNMQWAVNQSLGANEEIAAANYPNLRLFMVEQEPSLWPRADNRGNWEAATPKSVPGFSAVGYAFGRDLHTALNVPVGLIHCNWGGTRIEPWLSPVAVKGFPQLAEQVAQLDMLRDPSRRDEVGGNAEERWFATFNSKGPKVGDAWSKIDFDDSAWKPIAVPSSWSVDGLDQFDGVVYHRLTIELPASCAGQPAELTLGPIDDRDDAWINGVRVGATRDDGHWFEPRKYDVPANVLVAGKNVIGVRVLDTAALGGIGGASSKPEMLALRVKNGHAVPLAGLWKYLRGPTMGEIGTPPSANFNLYAAPSNLYNGMLATLRPHTIRGALWYQGESNRDNVPPYQQLLTALFADWRATFQSPNMAFGVVQLAPFSYGGDTGQTAMIREAQAKAVAADPLAGLAVTMDIGNPKDIHPTNKREVGKRLGLWALAKIYGRPVAFEGPTYAMMTVEGPKARIKLDHAEGLTARGGAPTHWLIAGADKVFYPAKATIDGATVIVEHPKVSAPVAVRYAWGDADEPNLFNKDGLPAAPFRTDDWPLGASKVEVSAAVESHRSAEPGFLPLMNGKDLAGWTQVNCAPATFTAKADETGQSIIHCTGVPTGVLRTDQMYENFVLELEWRHLSAGGNAGVFVWSDALTAAGQPFTRSIECQVMDGLESDWYTSDGDVFPIHGATMKPENPRPSGGDRAYPTEKRMNPSPAWNHYRITCNNGEISLAVNGAVVTRGTKCSPRMGYICLESEGSPVDFRNIRLKPLPSTNPAPAEIALAADGWKPLYNGVDFAGWNFSKEHEGHWKAKDWLIDFDGHAPDLWTARSYKDFELIADWRWSGPTTQIDYPVILPSGDNKTDDKGNPVLAKVPSAGDSGIYLRGSSKSQINIWCWPIGSGEVYGYRTDPEMPPEVRAGVTPKAAADRPIGQWNRFHARMKGDRLTVDLNGVRVLDNARLPGVNAEGPIALQNHGDAIQFANLFVRELTN